MMFLSLIRRRQTSRQKGRFFLCLGFRPLFFLYVVEKGAHCMHRHSFRHVRANSNDYVVVCAEERARVKRIKSNDKRRDEVSIDGYL